MPYSLPYSPGWFLAPPLLPPPLPPQPHLPRALATCSELRSLERLNSASGNADTFEAVLAEEMHTMRDSFEQVACRTSHLNPKP